MATEFKLITNALTAAAVVATALHAAASMAAPSSISEEQRLIQISQKLKPISNDQWNEIAGSKMSETYDIQKGDTLWDVSKRLFGNAYYWPKVWSLNTGISNPHVVAPGQKLAFVPGSSDAAPKLLSSAETAPPANPSMPASGSSSQLNSEPKSNGRHEYEKVPYNRWQPPDVSNAFKSDYDSYGIDKELKINIPSRFTFRVPALANDTTLPFLGEIVGSRREGVGLAQHETVFLKSNSQDLQVGTTYSIFADPEFTRERKSDRSGYVYRTIGEVKIVSVKDDLYVGMVTRAYDVIKRGDRVYPLLPLITDIKPVPSRTALESLVITGGVQSTRNTAQFRFVHFDRGIEDGVQIGNVFRIYDYYDPSSKKKLTDSDFLINADVMIVHATAQFSTGIVIRSRDTFSRGDFGVLLTDVSDIERQLTDRIHTLGGDNDPKRTAEDKELDELDELDRNSGEGLGRKEEAEIKELDQWDKVKDFHNEPSAEPTLPSSADTPTDEVEKAPSPEQPKTTVTPLEPSGDGSSQMSEPTLDEALDSPSVAPKGKLPPAPPAHLAPQPDQTLDAPTAPPATGGGDPDMPAELPPEATPYTPSGETTPNVEPAQPTMPDDLELKTQE